MNNFCCTALKCNRISIPLDEQTSCYKITSSNIILHKKQIRLKIFKNSRTKFVCFNVTQNVPTCFLVNTKKKGFFFGNINSFSSIYIVENKLVLYKLKMAIGTKLP